jgi:hypothetical protein
MSGYAKYPNKCTYWSKVNGVPTHLAVSNLYHRTCMSVTTLCTIEFTVQVAANLEAAFKKYGGLEENLSIDDSMILYFAFR